MVTLVLDGELHVDEAHGGAEEEGQAEVVRLNSLSSMTSLSEFRMMLSHHGKSRHVCYARKQRS